MKSVIAVTLGSNGFHLFDVSLDGSNIHTNQHLYDNVQAESYVDEGDNMSDQGIERITRSLAKFADHIRANPGRVCGAIATGTFRRINNPDAVLAQARETLGIDINVLSGRDESLLCYLGIASSFGFVDHNRLVIDVGGASTEVMLAVKNTLLEFVSIDIGCVSLARDHFSDDVLTPEHFSNARQYVESMVQPHADKFRTRGWEEAMGCGGTVSSLFSVMQVNRMCARSITEAGLQRFQTAVVEKGHPDEIALPTVPKERSRLLPAGTSLLFGLYDALGIERISPAFTSVGQGLIVQLFNSSAAKS